MPTITTKWKTYKRDHDGIHQIRRSLTTGEILARAVKLTVNNVTKEDGKEATPQQIEDARLHGFFVPLRVTTT